MGSLLNAFSLCAPSSSSLCVFAYRHLGITTLTSRRCLLFPLRRFPNLPWTQFMLLGKSWTHIDELLYVFLLRCLFFFSQPMCIFIPDPLFTMARPYFSLTRPLFTAFNYSSSYLTLPLSSPLTVMYELYYHPPYSDLSTLCI